MKIPKSKTFVHGTTHAKALEKHVIELINKSVPNLPPHVHAELTKHLMKAHNKAGKREFKLEKAARTNKYTTINKAIQSTENIAHSFTAGQTAQTFAQNTANNQIASNIQAGNKPNTPDEEYNNSNIRV